MAELEPCLNLPALADKVGIPIKLMRVWAKGDGFPLMKGGKVFPSDFLAWKERHLRLCTSADPEPCAEHKPYAPVHRNDLPDASRPRVAHLLSLAGIPA